MDWHEPEENLMSERTGWRFLAILVLLLMIGGLLLSGDA